jgi:hypothetical protein
MSPHASRRTASPEHVTALRRARLRLTASSRQALRRVLCLHVLSSFQRTGRSLLPIGLLTWRSPPRLSPSGEPSNLTRSFHFVSTPGRRLVSFFRRANSLPEKLGTENGWGCDLKDCVRGKKICSGWTLANLPTPLVGSRSVHSIYAQRHGLSTLDGPSGNKILRLRSQEARPFSPVSVQVHCRTFTTC